MTNCPDLDDYLGLVDLLVPLIGQAPSASKEGVAPANLRATPFCTVLSEEMNTHPNTRLSAYFCEPHPAPGIEIFL